MKKNNYLLSALVFALLSIPLHAETSTTQKINLAGKWNFEVDSADKGVKEAWFKRQLPQKISLPGTMSENGYGKYGSPGKWGVQDWAGWHANPMWHPVFKKDYRGAAWYQREVVIPEQWKDKHIRLFLERVCWVSEVWVDSKYIGRRERLSTPHCFEIGVLSPGKHRLTIRIDNRQLHYLGGNTHAYHEQSLTIFNGVVGKIELTARPQIFVKNDQVFADADTGVCKNVITVINTSLKTEKIKLAVEIDGKNLIRSVLIAPGEHPVEMLVKLPKESVRKWGEFARPLYSATVILGSHWGVDKTNYSFGFRKLETKGRQFVLNGRPLLLRGEANNAMFPLTGHPPMNVKEWTKIFQLFKSFGLNHLRCHSWTPPEAAFLAADSLGFFIQAELPNGETAVLHKDGEEWRKQEFLSILDTYGNHPSFAFYTNGNEAKTDKITPFKKLAKLGKSLDSRHLYSTISNPEASRNGDGFECDEYLVSHHGRGGWRRLEPSLNREFPNTMKDYRSTMIRNLPYVSHEVGQWYVYPDIRAIDKYTGVVSPRNLIAFKKVLEHTHQLDRIGDFVDATGRLSLLLYKEEIEHSLRTPAYGGFQLLGLQDSYDQGAAFVGQIDNFFDPKPYVTAKAFHRFCGPEVPLARFEKRVWLNNESFTSQIELANYGPQPLKHKKVTWSLSSDSGVISKGTFGPMDIPNTGLQPIGKISCDLSSVKKARKLKLDVEVEGTSIGNDWDLWVYPSELEKPDVSKLIVTTSLTDDIINKLKQGAKVVLFANHLKRKHPTTMTPPFWSPLMFSNQKQTLGLICHPSHPALKFFPTDTYNNWQWWELTLNGAAVEIGSMNTKYRPIVEAIDQPQKGKRLGVVFEGKVGKGSLLVCSFDLNRDLKKRPVARQLRYSLLRYAGSKEFAPQYPIDLEELLLTGNRISFLATRQLVKKVSVDSEHENNWGYFAVDGNLQTIWHTRWDKTQTPPPHQITLELKKPITIKGIIQTPRDNGSSNGRIAQYKVLISADGKQWNEVAHGTWKNNANPQKALFKKQVTTQWIRLVALSEVNGKPWTALAELDVLPAKMP